MNYQQQIAGWRALAISLLVVVALGTGIDAISIFGVRERDHTIDRLLDGLEKQQNIIGIAQDIARDSFKKPAPLDSAVKMKPEDMHTTPAGGSGHIVDAEPPPTYTFSTNDSQRLIFPSATSSSYTMRNDNYEYIFLEEDGSRLVVKCPVYHRCYGKRVEKAP